MVIWKDSKVWGDLKAGMICSLFHGSGKAGTSAGAVGGNIDTWQLQVTGGFPHNMVTVFQE